MDVKQVAQDSAYAAIGFASLSADQVRAQADKARATVETRQQEGRQQVLETLTSAREQFDALTKDVETRIEGLLEQLKGRLDELSALNDRARDELESRLPEQVRDQFNEVRTQVTTQIELLQKQIVGLTRRDATPEEEPTEEAA